ncbi:hypothetical protein GCM10022276_22710 [Sphingomonas limnosediminicola]|uniref:Uncharacterized protein n=1 Tax=Sphingomonas limnosediminicola TaxID=940133 RepID=A0ABP7LLW1_9SPHN
MTRDQRPCFINKDWVGETELPDRLNELLDLAFGMGPRVPQIRLKRAGRPILDRQLAHIGVVPRDALAHVRRNILATFR